MRILSILVLAATFAVAAHANPALHGTWSAAVEGQPLTVTFDANGAGKVNGTPMRWQALGPLLFVQQQGLGLGRADVHADAVPHLTPPATAAASDAAVSRRCESASKNASMRLRSCACEK